MTESRSAFEAGLGIELDPFQVRAFDALDAGSSVLVAAPTGAGKTLVAEYAIHRALAEGGKVFYTTPLKALSNQKYGDFSRAYGRHRVGLLTGDNAVNGDAPIVVMTTEVLRNMIYAGSPALADLRYVVLDEVHYLQNRYRGAVWEEVIIHLAPDVDLVCLSATVSNAEEFADWIATVRGHTAAIIEERRPVELTNLYAIADRASGDITVLPTFVRTPGGERRPNPDAARYDARGNERGGRGRPRTRLTAPRRSELVGLLREESMLPVITFIFSRNACDDAVQQCLAAGLRLTDADERRTLRKIADARSAPLTDDDLDALGYDDWLSGFENGIAAHHAGLVPPLKEAVEEAFAAGLVKAVFATETLSLGINMPARTVVIEKLSKFTGEHHEFLTPGEYTQLTGRAGRRGIDPEGYAVVCWNPFVPFDQVAGLASRRTSALDVVVPADVQHGDEPRRPLRTRDRAPVAQPLVRAVPRRSRRREPRASRGAQRGHVGEPARGGPVRPRRRRRVPPSAARGRGGPARSLDAAGAAPTRWIGSDRATSSPPVAAAVAPSSSSTRAAGAAGG